MKKALFFGFILSIIAFTIIVDDPLLTFFNFVIAGIVPGFNVSLGYLPSIGLLVFLFWALTRWVRSIRQQMIEKQAEIYKALNEQREFAETHASESEKNSSVISAPQANSVKTY